MNIDTLNAYCGSVLVADPPLCQGRFYIHQPVCVCVQCTHTLWLHCPVFGCKTRAGLKCGLQPATVPDRRLTLKACLPRVSCTVICAQGFAGLAAQAACWFNCQLPVPNQSWARVEACLSFFFQNCQLANLTTFST